MGRKSQDFSDEVDGQELFDEGFDSEAFIASNEETPVPPPSRAKRCATKKTIDDLNEERWLREQLNDWDLGD